MWSSGAKPHSMDASTLGFFLRHVHVLKAERKDLLENWEMVLCGMSALDTVASSGMLR